MPEMIELSIILPVSPERIYRAWLDGDQHAAFTGSGATAESVVGGEFTAWDGYISGSNLEFQPYSRIVQLWRTTDFPQESADSRLEILLEAVGKHTKLTLIHSQIPDGQGEGYKDGWQEYYFTPMLAYFSG
jgi:uncharacterized protein YndB with AHSA1/START domain